MKTSVSGNGNPVCQASSTSVSENGNPVCQASSGNGREDDNRIHQEGQALLVRLSQDPFQQQYLRIGSGVVREDSETILLPENLVQQVPAKLICLVCLERLRTCVFKECCHLLVCINCQQFYRQCPMCGEHINDFLKISWGTPFG